jgi:DNA-binding NarL/FixJ family response regulator
MVVRLVLADDHEVLRKGLISLLAQHEFTVIAEVGDGLGLLQILKEVEAEVILLDISMPNLSGLEAIEEIRRIKPDIKIIMLTMHKDVEFLQRAITLGANGYVVKSTGETQLVSAIKQVLAGEMAIDFGVAGGCKDYNCNSNQKMSPIETRKNLPSALTTREIEILKLVAKGFTDKEISEQLFISIKTIEKHKTKLKRKLGVKRLAELVRYAVDRGYI